MYSSNVLFLTCSHDIENDAHAPAVYSLSISPHSRCLEYLRCEVAGSTTKCLHQRVLPHDSGQTKVCDFYQSLCLICG